MVARNQKPEQEVKDALRVTRDIVVDVRRKDQADAGATQQTRQHVMSF